MEVGIINNSKLVDLFGTDKNKEYFKKYNKIGTSLKNSILKRASRECNILDIGNGKYEILEVYNVKIPTSTSKILNNKAYKILCPIIINNLIDSKNNGENVLNMSLITYCGLLNIVHKTNFNSINYNKKLVSKDYNIDMVNITNFFNISKRMIKYNMESALTLLQQSGIIYWQHLIWIKHRDVALKNNHSSVETNVINTHRRATEEEIRYIEDCKSQIIKKYNIVDIDNFDSIYYNKNYSLAIAELNELLIKRNIVYYYKGYEIYYTDIEKSINFMKLFEDFNKESYNNIFYDIINDNIKTSYDKKEIENLDIEKAKSDYKFISFHALNRKSTTLKYFDIVTTNNGNYHSYESIINEIN